MFVVGCVVLSIVAPAEELPFRRDVLSNGITVLTLPVDGVDSVAMVTLYNVGFLHEPVGKTQMAHLLEHLVCNAPTASYRQNESLKFLDQIGGLPNASNAETLIDHTRYDRVVPGDRLRLAVRIERERLTSLNITPKVIRDEAPRVYSETDAVERNPQSGMFKHAMMACSQAWAHGQTEALVRGGLDELTPREMDQFRKRFYRPDRMTIILVGGFDRKDALELLGKHLGDLKSEEKREPVQPIDWAKAPKRATVRWDARPTAVCLAFPPPTEGIEALALNALGTAIMMKLRTDKELAEVADAVMVSAQFGTVGPAPFVVYASAKPGIGADRLEHVLKKQWKKARDAIGDNEVQIVRLLSKMQLAQLRQLDAASLKQVAKTLAARLPHLDQSKAEKMVLVQTAINLGMVGRALGAHPVQLQKQLEEFESKRFQKLVQSYLPDDKMIITHLVPMPSEE